MLKRADAFPKNAKNTPEAVKLLASRQVSVSQQTSKEAAPRQRARRCFLMRHQIDATCP
ncbi:hypothetical protein CLDAP_26470 [Caldilinea aerophila DSM 14535 = NBRC 104270]|uniref:Uncharacterized protein n=1 Tax=Caldilinea aerophila (strain DSM 14535 / JCM 11387 / NBRC 104270 / STL-6-O1) TaxID=926550 RepID=I0I5Z9_CALAS|nr:hypothetical protein CLDAP_26470 [Caldilinea aerophila DSM 14535 = NBRC 104270]